MGFANDGRTLSLAGASETGTTLSTNAIATVRATASIGAIRGTHAILAASVLAARCAIARATGAAAAILATGFVSAIGFAVGRYAKTSSALGVISTNAADIAAVVWAAGKAVALGHTRRVLVVCAGREQGKKEEEAQA